MNQYQAKELELLRDLDRICLKHGIPCFLAYQTALQAFQLGKFSENSWKGHMMIFIRDYRRFVEVVEKEKKDGYVLSHLGNNRHYPGFTLYYADAGTLCLSKLGDTSPCCAGLGVNIFVICDLPKSKLARVFGRILEVGMIQRALPYALPYPTRMICKWFVRMLLLFYGKDSNKKILDVWLKIFTDPQAKQVFVRNQFAARRTFSPTFFLYRKRVLLEGTPFFIPGRSIHYFSKIYGALWESRVSQKLLPPKSMLFSTTLSYAEFVEAFGGEKKMKRNYRRIFRNRLAIGTIRPFQAKIEWAWSVANAAGEKLMLEDRYEKNQDYYRNLYRGGAYGQLRNEMEPFRLYEKKYKDVPIEMENYLQRFIMLPQDDEAEQLDEQ